MKATLAKSSYYVLYDPETQEFLTSWGDVDFNFIIYTSENVLHASQYTQGVANDTLLFLQKLCREDDEVSKKDLDIAERLKIKEIEVVHKMFTGNV